jgi:hypothetical protein
MGAALSVVFLIGVAIFMVIACIAGGQRNVSPDSLRSPPSASPSAGRGATDKNHREEFGKQMGSLVFAGVVLVLLVLCINVFRPS